MNRREPEKNPSLFIRLFSSSLFYFRVILALKCALPRSRDAQRGAMAAWKRKLGGEHWLGSEVEIYWESTKTWEKGRIVEYKSMRDEYKVRRPARPWPRPSPRLPSPLLYFPRSSTSPILNWNRNGRSWMIFSASWTRLSRPRRSPCCASKTTTSS